MSVQTMALSVGTIALLVQTMLLSVETIALSVQTMALSVGTIALLVQTMALLVETKFYLWGNSALSTPEADDTRRICVNLTSGTNFNCHRS
ncbi:MAG: hypothetical protein V7L14_25140 [Nostoc sp.]|uniref:hypothetical protein n=1 Tax=Nostoc sp. TaxID=1180 RepID=UPI002FF60CBA